MNRIIHSPPLHATGLRQRATVLPWLPAVLAVAALLAPAAQASQLVPQNLKKMIEVSDVIVSGQVSKVSDGIANGVPFTEVTLKVKGSIKRDLAPGSNYSFRQYGLLKPRKMADGRYLLPARIEGMPTWTVGEQVTTFMNRPGARTGLVTPVGLAQGKFSAGGARSANSFNNVNLFKGMTVDAHRLSKDEAAMLASHGGAVETGALLSLVKRAVKEQWIAQGVMR